MRDFQSPRPPSTIQSATDNRKEREPERQREMKDREKRISRELSPLDHRGEPDVEKKSNRRSLTREHSNNGKSESRSPCLSAVIYPLISEVSSLYNSIATAYTYIQGG